jgi:hypothetical protein
LTCTSGKQNVIHSAFNINGCSTKAFTSGKMEKAGNYGYYDADYYYEYNYTYDESINYLPLDELVPSVTFYTLIGLLGIAGNVLVIVAILTFPRMKSITNIFLLSLASADLLLVLICVPIKVFNYTLQFPFFYTKCSHQAKCSQRVYMIVIRSSM